MRAGDVSRAGSLTVSTSVTADQKGGAAAGNNVIVLVDYSRFACCNGPAIAAADDDRAQVAGLSRQADDSPRAYRSFVVRRPSLVAMAQKLAAGLTGSGSA